MSLFAALMDFFDYFMCARHFGLLGIGTYVSPPNTYSLTCGHCTWQSVMSWC